MISHVEHVLSVTSSSAAAARSALAASWSRSMKRHGLDPAEARSTGRVTDGDYRRRWSEMSDCLQIAAPKLDQLFGLVGSSGCGVLLTDADGVVLEKRCESGDEAEFNAWGIWDGAIWSEEFEGTNGVGTCLIEERPVSIHRDQHFFQRNIGISCIGAPVFGAKGELMGALDVSSARFDQTPAVNRMISALVRRIAGEIEQANFCTAHSASRIIALDAETEGANALLAVDRDDVVIGATRSARKKFDLGIGAAITPVLASDLLFAEPGQDIGFDGAARMAVVQALTLAGNNASKAAKILGIGRATLYRRMERLNIDRSSLAQS